MIVERRWYTVHEGREQEAIDIIKEAWQDLGFPNAHRIYRGLIGPYDVVVHELEFKDLQERQAFWADFMARPKTRALMAPWTKVRAPGGGSELWQLVE
jgi:hypothetical protein